MSNKTIARRNKDCAIKTTASKIGHLTNLNLFRAEFQKERLNIKAPAIMNHTGVQWISFLNSYYITRLPLPSHWILHFHTTKTNNLRQKITLCTCILIRRGSPPLENEHSPPPYLAHSYRQQHPAYRDMKASLRNPFPLSNQFCV